MLQGIRNLWKRISGPIVTMPGGNRSYGSMILDSAYSVPIAKASADWVNTYGKHPWLHAVVTRIAEGVGSSPWNIYQEPVGSQMALKAYERKQAGFLDGTERKAIGLRKNLVGRPVYGHPLINLLNRPNPVHTGYKLRVITQVYIELCGECFWIIERDTSTGRPCALWPIPPHWVEELPDNEDKTFVCKLKGRPVKVPRQDMVWFQEINPYDPYGRGLGPAMAATDEINADELAAKQNLRFMYNGARPDIMMILKGKLRNPLDARRIKENWYSEYGGVWNQYKMALVEGDVADVKPLSTKPKDMEFTQLRQNARNTIVGSWGMPPSVIGIVEDVNRANAESGEYVFGKWIVYPRLIAFQDVITSDLVTQYPDYQGCWMEHSDPVPDNRAARAMEMLQAMQVGSITYNEHRESLGLRPDPNGNVYLVDPKKTVGKSPGMPIMGIGMPIGNSGTGPQQETLTPVDHQVQQILHSPTPESLYGGEANNPKPQQGAPGEAPSQDPAKPYRPSAPDLHQTITDLLAGD